MPSTRAAALVTVVLAATAALPAEARPKPADPPHQVVLSPEGNHLWAYDAVTGDAQLVSRAQNGGEPEITLGTSTEPASPAPEGTPPRDINGQVCVSPDGQHFVAGEDTVVAGPAGGSSHDPRIAGWGWFTISGRAVGDIRIEQVGKLAPESGRGPGYAGDPDNFGCGFLDAGRLVTTAIGNPLPGDPANGQLFLWFGPFESGFGPATTAEGAGYLTGTVDHCQILEADLATAGGIAVDSSGDVYVATNRPDDAGNPGGIWRYSGRWPSTYEECTPAFVKANITKTLVVPPLGLRPADPFAPTPSSVVISPEGTLVVASVFSGTVSEYTEDGMWLRDIWPVAPVSPRRGPTQDTPFGLAFTDDGTLWLADIGILLDRPAAEQGSLVRTVFADPQPLGETVATGLTFPDGLGVYTPPGRSKDKGKSKGEH